MSMPLSVRKARASSTLYMRHGSTVTSVNPAPASLSRYSVSSSAPAMQPTHNSMLRRTSAGTSPRTITSDTANCPPGFSTRNASRSTASLSLDRLITQFEMMTSTESSGRGIDSIVPLRNSTFVAPALRWFSRARASISSVMSRPYALPVGPTRLADSRTSMPPPDPKSSTVWPGSRASRAVGLPHPSDAVTASAGRPPVSASEYRLEVIGSPQPHAAGPQQPLLVDAFLTDSAMAPYFSRTAFWMSDMMCSVYL